MKNDIKAELAKFSPQLKKLSKMITKAEDSWTDHFNENDPEDMYLRDMFYRIREKLDDVRRITRQVNGTVTDEGTLFKNKTGRYEIAFSESVYFTSGNAIEYLRKDEDGTAAWVNSRVEHNGSDYYIVSDPKLSMDGLTARKKILPDLD